ncbi:hemicentin-2-like [Patiria miniata]|uniref:Ig-like domain-containing protein n=1 Tax=Patiria miniata TaxID=46514 RepID=A0A913ZYF6_PATMI|nr:hemicentin-2-like [Patiria miniata]
MALSTRTVSCLQLLLLLPVITWMQSHGVGAIRAVTRPINTTGVVGQDAEFSCSVADKSANEVLTWRLQWDDTASPQSVHLSAEHNATMLEFDESAKHATYTTRYSVNGPIHTTVLHIANIQPSDAGSVACMYQITVSGSVIYYTIPEYTPVRLTVWIPPTPTCSFTNLDPNATAYGSPTIGATVELTCADTVGVPTPELTWRADERNPNTVNRSVYYHELQAEDNGRWFECQAISPASQTPVICSVRPMAVPPTAKVTPDVLNIIEGGNIEFTCTGSGLPEISSYQWFLDGSPTHAVNSQIYPSIKVTNTATGSVLTLEKISKLGQTVVSCEVMLSAGLTGRASGLVVISKQQVTVTPAARQQAHSEQQLGTAPSVFAIPLAFLFLLLILMVALLVWHRQLRHDSDTQKLSSDTTVNGVAPKQAKRSWKVYRVTTV